MSKFPYNLDQPNRVIVLPEILNEISGLEYVSKDTLVCVQDETATIFFISPKTGGIQDSIVFGKNGDFEGIARYKSKFYVLRSDGRISKVSQNGKVKHFEFKKSKGFDFEGICLDQRNDRLLIACKEHKKDKKSVYIYAFSLEKKKYLKKPVFILDKDDLGKKFQASGIAIGRDQAIYIPSAYSKQMAKLSSSGKIEHILKLKHPNFFQAEGICFGENGELYISNEKAMGVPNLMVFK